jgi:predicted regulator of Ras-like GTPase activity (Roadblock/LC7/MglB family)
MDFTHNWKLLLSENSDIQGGALISADGVLISQTAFGNHKTSAAYCAAIVAIAHQLTWTTECGECEAIVLECEHRYIVLMPVLDKTVFAVLAREQAKVGLLILDMSRVIDDGSFGPGLAPEPIFPPRPPKRGSAHATPAED